MNRLALVALLVLALVAPSRASNYAGKLDLASDPTFEPLVLRELHDGMWLLGMQTQVWHLQRLSDGAEIFHASVFWATRAEGTDTAYGPSLGFTLGPTFRATVGQLAVVADSLASLPPFVAKLGNFTSVDVYGGYRPVTGADDHHWIYGVGGKVQVKFSDLACWVMKSCPGSTGL
jgi:hypothetical protein